MRANLSIINILPNRVADIKVWNMFKVNNKDMSLLLTLNIFHTLF